MLRDHRRVRPGDTLSTDLCVVGAGVAGLVVARRCAERGVETLLVESGAMGPDPRAQALNHGEVIGDPYAGLSATRHRQVGGMVNLWNTSVRGAPGAKFVSLDRGDLVDWPFGLEDLAPWYARATAVCGLGAPRWDGRDWATADRPLLPLPEDRLVSRVYLFGDGSCFTQGDPEALRKATGVQLLAGATVVGLEHEGGRVRGLRAVTATGTAFRIAARRIVLAAGAIENARLLLLAGIGGESTGRGFMEHPRDYTSALTPRSSALYRQAGLYDQHLGAGGAIVGGHLTVAEQARSAHGLPRAAVTLLASPKPMPRLVRGWRRMTGSPVPGGGYGWSGTPALEAVCDGFRLVVNLEQRPHPDNRITLGAASDALGCRQARLHWRWRDDEQGGLERLRAFLARTFAEAGLGRLSITPGARPDPNAHHHAGTTRMSTDPEEGVVDPEGKVHGTENLFVAGASVFPSSGYVNPTLTIVALALRLAAHLGETCDVTRDT